MSVTLRIVWTCLTAVDCETSSDVDPSNGWYLHNLYQNPSAATLARCKLVVTLD